MRGGQRGVWAGLVLIVAAIAAPRGQGPTATVTVRNPLDEARPHETIVIGAADIAGTLGVDDPRRVYVRDAATGRDRLAQAVDNDDDGRFDALVFQADFSPGEVLIFRLSAGDRRVYTKDQFRAYGRFVRERRDDFAWENDVTAHRMYGPSLETWAQEPLTSSAVDVWLKRTSRLVINDWYMVDDYHRDHGEGADFYSAGKSRGCGGSGIWEAGRLFVSANFRESRVLANGPLRVLFELTYAAWDAGGQPVSEVKRVTLDAGEHLNRFESRYTTAPGRALQHAAGIKANPAGTVAVSRGEGVLRTWEPVKDNGAFGCGIVVDPALLADALDADGNHLVVARVPETRSVVYYAGAAWDRAGEIGDAVAWDRYLHAAARRLRAPLQVTLQK
jgi:pectinesterase